MHTILRTGPEIDATLQPKLALAQADDAETILIHSAALRLPRSSLLRLLLHEAAHLEQLRRPGHNTVAELEAEAWEAASHWERGLPYRIQGRGRLPLFGLAIVQGGDKGHPFAPPWYASNPVEPISKSKQMNVKKVVLLEKMTLDSILDQIIAAKDREVLIVSHGDGNGLALPLREGASSGAERDLMVALAADRNRNITIEGGTTIRTPIRTNADLATLTRMTEAQVAALRAKRTQVQEIQLKHLAIRACNMGISKDTMEAFLEFFGAQSLSAPTLFDSYGHFSPAFVPDLDAWTKAKRKDFYHISIDAKVGFGVRETKNSLVYTIAAASTDKKAFEAWYRKHIVAGELPPSGVVYHAMKVVRPVSKTAPSVYFVQDQAFLNNLVTVSA
ncbi:hypothetical protein [Bryobacter aggregatus]|uniref:hypothetical protein n=1 Tax=Bryobacter aggregatus TaxID=360054 RepID=UPI0004E21647|nr:hypothetical protein [Bryobacter aggregatus]